MIWTTILYFSDSCEVDIVGGNLYQKYLNRLLDRRNNNKEPHPELCMDSIDPDLPSCRNIPEGIIMKKSTLEECFTILVSTGVYQPGQDVHKYMEEGKHCRTHRDFPSNPSLKQPSLTCADVEEAIQFIFKREGIAEN